MAWPDYLKLTTHPVQVEAVFTELERHFSAQGFDCVRDGGNLVIKTEHFPDVRIDVVSLVNKIMGL